MTLLGFARCNFTFLEEPFVPRYLLSSRSGEFDSTIVTIIFVDHEGCLFMAALFNLD